MMYRLGGDDFFEGFVRGGYVEAIGCLCVENGAARHTLSILPLLFS